MRRSLWTYTQWSGVNSGEHPCVTCCDSVSQRALEEDGGQFEGTKWSSARALALDSSSSLLAEWCLIFGLATAGEPGGVGMDGGGLTGLFFVFIFCLDCIRGATTVFSSFILTLVFLLRSSCPGPFSFVHLPPEYLRSRVQVPLPPNCIVIVRLQPKDRDR